MVCLIICIRLKRWIHCSGHVRDTHRDKTTPQPLSKSDPGTMPLGPMLLRVFSAPQAKIFWTLFLPWFSARRRRKKLDPIFTMVFSAPQAKIFLSHFFYYRFGARRRRKFFGTCFYHGFSAPQAKKILAPIFKEFFTRCFQRAAGENFWGPVFAMVSARRRRKKSGPNF